jgi:hypothetical protein
MSPYGTEVFYFGEGYFEDGRWCLAEIVNTIPLRLAFKIRSDRSQPINEKVMEHLKLLRRGPILINQIPRNIPIHATGTAWEWPAESPCTIRAPAWIFPEEMSTICPWSLHRKITDIVSEMAAAYEYGHEKDYILGTIRIAGKGRYFLAARWRDVLLDIRLMIPSANELASAG